MGLVSDKNFIVANAVENILAGKSITQSNITLNTLLHQFVNCLHSTETLDQHPIRLLEEENLW